MKKKILLAIGVILLFISISALPAVTAVETKSAVESLNDTRYKFSGKAFLFYSPFGTDICDIDFIFIWGTAHIEGECSEYSADFLVSYIFTLSTDADYATVDPGIGLTNTYRYNPYAHASMIGFYLLPWTIEINEI